MKFKVNENETIADCLSRMKMQGYMPVKRIPVLLVHNL
ncbi:NETI motif-containing protein [Staphylococcus aureus]|nr:NETI motif-containing protein [Staphylococcus aureus]